ncbi:FAD-dependent oxidoreductase [Actinomadura rugatobispora]|uniref:FAD-dependent oxidoreductase n=1 Tax=Actinomadura rugatobispora TaxID=1994 RepID=A0ABW1A832_9ACTN|nr:hypothetical protein GCM10010200_047980 [Actinomadura rugatobispora]
MPGLCRAGVEDVWRGHVPRDQGYELVQVLARACRAGGVEIVPNTRVQRLVEEDGRVVGVVADDVGDRAGAVVFAHGPDLLARHYPPQGGPGTRCSW